MFCNVCGKLCVSLMITQIDIVETWKWAISFIFYTSPLRAVLFTKSRAALGDYQSCAVQRSLVDLYCRDAAINFIIFFYNTINIINNWKKLLLHIENVKINEMVFSITVQEMKDMLKIGVKLYIMFSIMKCNDVRFVARHITSNISLILMCFVGCIVFTIAIIAFWSFHAYACTERLYLR